MNITPEIVGLTFSAAAEILLAVTVLTVHESLKKEHKFDKKVESEITFEHIVGTLAIFLMIGGYVLQAGFLNFLL